MENQINKRLRLLIKEKNITQIKFCEIIGIKDSALRDILTRGYNPNTDILMKIASKFPQYSINWLLTGVGDMETNSNDVVSDDSKLQDKINELKEENMKMEKEITELLWENRQLRKEMKELESKKTIVGDGSNVSVSELKESIK